MYRQQMGMGGGANPMAAMTSADPNKTLETEKAALEMVRPFLSSLGVLVAMLHLFSSDQLSDLLSFDQCKQRLPQSCTAQMSQGLTIYQRDEQVDHKWKLEGSEERAAEVLRMRLRQQLKQRK